MGRHIGIDLGTTNSVVAICDGPRARVLDNVEAKMLTPSMVSYRKRKGEEEFIVGSLSYDYWEFDPENTISSIKRFMGRGFNDPQVEKAKQKVEYRVVEPSDGTKDSLRVILGGKEYSPVDISAMILGKLKKDAEFRLGEEVTHAVVTVPAYFSEIQHDATRKAVLKAGMRVIKILDEPTAAAIAYGVDSGDSEKVKTILVYDLGGGTFDISVLFLAGGVFAKLNLEGDMWLGGDDLDQVLIDYVVQQIKREYDVDPTTDKKAMVKLRKAARNAKERLSASKTADMIVPGLMQDADGNFIGLDEVISQGQFIEMIRPIVKKTVDLVEKAVRNAKFVDEDSDNIDLSQIDYVLMAGNSTIIPLVQQVMEDMFGREKILRKDNPKNMVALGAAIFAVNHPYIICKNPDPDDPAKNCGHANPLDAEVCEHCKGPLDKIDDENKPPPPGDLAPFNYGIQSKGDKFNVFIKKNDPYPTPVENRQPQTFYTTVPNMPFLSIQVYGGDNLEIASANEKQGEGYAILPRGLGKDTPVHITIWLDHDGVFKIGAQLDDGTDLKPWVSKGDIDAKVVEIMTDMEAQIAEVNLKISPKKQQELEQQKSKVWDHMNDHNFEDAKEEAEKLKKMVKDITGGPGPELPENELVAKANNLIANIEIITKRYNWAFNPALLSSLSALIKEVKSALGSNDMELLKQKVSELEKETDKIPKVVTVLISLTIAIASRVQPFDVVLATRLSQQLLEVENSLKNNEKDAVQKLDAFVKELTNAIKIIGEKNVIYCSSGHKVPKGQRFCPVCGEDILVPDAAIPRASSIISSSGKISF